MGRLFEGYLYLQAIPAKPWSGHDVRQGMPAGRADPEQKKRGFFGGGGEKKDEERGKERGGKEQERGSTECYKS